LSAGTSALDRGASEQAPDWDAAAAEPGFPPAAEAPSPRARSAGAVMIDLLALIKPRITSMVILTTLGGFWLAGRLGDRAALPRPLLALTLVGTTLIVAAANTLNMYLERDTDALMARTRTRPLPAGRLEASSALWLGMILSAAALPILTFGVNAATGALAAVALVSYVLLYTPLKRRTTASLLIGAVPGAIPPLLGWTAAVGGIEWPGIALFGVLFLWQIPHFLAIATFRKDDYRRAGLKILPVERGDRVTRIHIVAYLAALVMVTLVLVPAGIAGRFYLVAASLLGGGFFAMGLWGLRPTAGVRWARGLFLASIVYLVLLLAALVIG
jgi:heme o synthase